MANVDNGDPREGGAASASPGPTGPTGGAGLGGEPVRTTLLTGEGGWNSPPGNRTLERGQSLAILLAVASVVLGFLASLDLMLLPVLPPALLWAAHPLLVLLGIVAGGAAVRRGRAVDEERWAVVDEPLATAQEREYAHKEAERERRVATTAFLAAPVFVGYWWLYQFGAAGPGSWTLPISGLAGFVAGFLVASRGGGPERRY